MISKTPGPASRGARRLVIAALACVLVAGCSGNDGVSADEPAPTELPMADINPVKAADVRDDGTLRIGVASFPATFNPVHVDGVASSAPQILAPTLGSAVRVAEDGSWSPDPDYATKVKISKKKPLTVRVELNEQAVWQGGTAITSADMVQFVAAMQDDDYAAAAAPVFDDIDRVEPDGDFAYDIVFEKPNADWPAAVYPALPKAFTRSAEVFNSAMTAKAPSANGPFLVSRIERKTGTITLERNPRWWGEPPKLESIVWRIGEPDVLAAAHRAGELEAAPVTPQNLTKLNDAERRASRGEEWSHLTINGGRGPLTDVGVRRAVIAAVDVDRIVRETSNRHGAPTDPMDSVVLLPGQVGHRPADREQKLAKARKLLAKAGWKRDGQGPARRKGKPLKLMFPVPDTMSGAVQRAEAIADDLGEVGIKVVVSEVPGDTFFQKAVIPLDFDLTTFAWRARPFELSDTERLFTPIDSPLNFTGRASKSVDQAFAAAIKELDDDDRISKIAGIDKAVRAQASILPLAVTPSVMAVDPRVVNYGPTALADLDWTIVGFAAPKDD